MLRTSRRGFYKNYFYLIKDKILAKKLILSSFVASLTNSSTDVLRVSPYSLVYDPARTARMRAPNASLEVPRSKLNEGGDV